MSEEYDLKKSENKIGQLYPILKSKDGQIIDGFHRQKADPNWKSLVVPEIDNEEKLLLARLIANFHRRQITREEKEEWINGLAKIYEKQGLKVAMARNQGGFENQIKNRISEVTGLSSDTVSAYLSEDYKQEPPTTLHPLLPAFEKVEKALGKKGAEKYRKQILAEAELTPQERGALTKKREHEKEERERKREENKRKKEEKRKERDGQFRKEAEESAKEKLLQDKQFIKQAAKLAPLIKDEEDKVDLPFDIPSVDEQLDKVFSAMAKIKPHSKKEVKQGTDFVAYIRGYIKRKHVVCSICGESHLQWSCGHDF